MPELNGRLFIGQLDRLQIQIYQATVEPHCSDSFLRVLELPENTACQSANKRMIQISLPPDWQRPGFLLKKQPVNSLALRGQHLLNVLGGRLEVLQIFLM